VASLFSANWTQLATRRLEELSGEEEPTNSMAQQTVVVNSSDISQVEEFVPGSDWKHYVKRMEMFFEVNIVLEAKK